MSLQFFQDEFPSEFVSASGVPIIKPWNAKDLLRNWVLSKNFAVVCFAFISASVLHFNGLLIKTVYALCLIVCLGLGFYFTRHLLFRYLSGKIPGKKLSPNDSTEKTAIESESKDISVYNSSSSLFSDRAPYFGPSTIFKAPESMNPDQSSWNETNWIASDLWITVFGFGENDFPVVYKTFLGQFNVINHICGSGKENWIHIHYSQPSVVNTVLKLDQMEISAGVLVSVKRTNMDHLQDVRSQLPLQAPESPEEAYQDFASRYSQEMPEYAIRQNYMTLLERRTLQNAVHGDSGF